MTLLPDIKEINVDIEKIQNDHTKENNVSLSILRLDKIHPDIPGNKFFKLYYFLEQAISRKKMIITFGGAYSNHLAATAIACKMIGIKCTGIVRGEEPKTLSHTLLFCKEQGMLLQFISREDYKSKNEEDFIIEPGGKLGDHIIIPEGGYSKEGAMGAALISNFYKNNSFTHICCAAGTGTTLAGLIKSSIPSQNIIGFSSLKHYDDFETRIEYLLGKSAAKNYFLVHDFHFGGYAKITTELISFMNKFYQEFGIPTDFVYTAKMMFGIFELIKIKFFPRGSKILCIHTGGLQGNLSLPPRTLNF